jgi:hypothetical protein
VIHFDAVVHFDISNMRATTITTPTRSFVLGDPKVGTVYGFVLRLPNDAAIINTYDGPAEIGVVSDLDPNSTIAYPIPIWGGKVIGHVLSLTPRDGWST